MMEVLEWLAVLGAIVLLMALGFVLFKSQKHIFITPKYKKSHKRAETRLLNHILDDMRTNKKDWIATPYDMSMQRAAHFVNDKKNMAIVVDGGKSSVTIKMNIKSAAKYMENSEDTIATPISGDHVIKFLQKVDECIDTRGKELSFIEKTLKDRL